MGNTIFLVDFIIVVIVMYSVDICEKNMWFIRLMNVPIIMVK